MNGAARRDCGYGKQSDCEAANCCWGADTAEWSTDSSSSNLIAAQPMLGAGTPVCFHKQSIVGGYTVQSASAYVPSETQRPGWLLQLGLADGNGYFGADAKTLQVQAVFETKHRLRVRISDPSANAWEVPESVLPLAGSDTSLMRVEDAYYKFSYTSVPFGFAVTRVDDGEVVFNSTAPVGPDGKTPLFNGLIVSEQYLELSTSLPAQPVLYGLGEKVTTLQLATKGKPLTFWARDAATPVDLNEYGSHPFYIENRRTTVGGNTRTRSHGAWLRNSNGMDVVIRDAAAARANFKLNHPEAQLLDEEDAAQHGHLTYRVIGGLLDFFVYVGSDSTASSTPASIVQLYHYSVGFPHMPPFWSLGWHQCRWGYSDIGAVQDMVDRYASAGLPLDTAWNDIDYLNNFEDFTTNPDHFPMDGLRTFIDKLHANGQHYVVIIDPAIHNRTGYSTFDNGIKQDVFIKQASGKLFVGKVWPGTAAFPAFIDESTRKWWAGEIAAFRKQVPVDGLWIDMNEASNFCKGDCDTPSNGPAPTAAVGAHGQRHSVELQGVHARRRGSRSSSPQLRAKVRPASILDPPYRIWNNGNGADLNMATLDVDATHGPQKWLEYNVHNMYGFSESIATATALESETGARSLVVSRSTFSGSGKHAAHWLGDNYSAWDSMANSIAGVLSMNFFGVPLVGADICGFIGDTTEELCARWMALGSFYPFARNHNGIGNKPQEPYNWPTVTSISKKTLAARYSLLHVYNTLFFQAHTQGGVVARPLFFNFAQDAATFPIQAQFMLGSALLITPVLTQGASSVQGYFPQKTDDGAPARWYDWWSGMPFTGGADNGGWATLQADWQTIPLHVAGGHILPLQVPGNNTGQQAKNPFWLLVAPDAANKASGSLFLDDGLALQVGPQSRNNLQAAFAYAGGALSYGVAADDYPAAAGLHFQAVQVLGIDSAPKGASVNGQAAPADAISYDAQNKKVTLNKMQLPLSQKFNVIFSF